MLASSHAFGADARLPRILLVEDDRLVREGLAENLRLCGMSVTEADSGYAFHVARRRGSFDVAILDVNLPDTSGFDLVASMADDSKRTGVIMLTARTGAADRIRGYSEGADLYLTKPFASEELVLAVRNLLRRVAPEPVKKTAMPEVWRLDVLLKRLFAPDGRSILLSGREVLLIEQFVGKNGEAIARHTLSETLGYGIPGSDNRAFDAVLRRLRQKLTEADLDPPIASVHNLGLRFVPPLSVG